MGFDPPLDIDFSAAMIDMHMEVLKWMSFDSLKQELTKRGLPTDGLEPVLLERLVHWHRQQHIDSAASNDAFHKLTDCVNGDDELIEEQQRGSDRPP